jgi:hypothetical protein
MLHHDSEEIINQYEGGVVKIIETQKQVPERFFQLKRYSFSTKNSK